MFKGLGVESFVDITRVRECRQAEDLDFWRGRRVWCGLDLSQTDDNTALAMVTESDGVIYAKVWGFIPENQIDIKSQREKVNYRALIKHGDCFACGDDVIGYGFVESFILGLYGRFTSGGGGVLVVEKGQKGKGVYVVNSSKFDNKEAENAIAAESEEFKSNVSKLKKETDRLSKHYPESYKAGDIDKDEYAAVMAELPVNIMENQKFSAIDAQGEHIVKGITVEVGGRRFGVFSAGSGTDYVTDLESVPMKGINISRGIMNYNHQISNAAGTLTAIRNSRKLHRSFDLDGAIEELRGSDPWESG